VGVASEAVSYNESFYGFSTGTLGSGQTLVRFLALVLGSRFALWFALVTSGKFGFERDVVEKAALNRLPLPDLRKFSEDKSAEIYSLFDALAAGAASWTDVDQWVANLYGLGATDLQVIADTLSYNAPFSTAKLAAQAPPQDLTGFCAQVERELVPWAKRFDTIIKAKPMPTRALSPWCGITLQRAGSTHAVDLSQHWDGLLLVADASATTEMVVHAGPDTLFVARLAQQRYWTTTQARLLAQHIVWNELDFIAGKDAG
jgi:hypothetical protein